ncbi:aspartic peptidase domain-containing protein [Podospora fimiseda]|uniref:Aspartic peptidase domain-containing protein n=1 Tax=Podospora fimiseda TaxID=252190 RepID=A0AAN7BM30_9PEZI|nr:aspartic peptidase domain-containing protein [Podospora fimiseda]
MATMFLWVLLATLALLVGASPTRHNLAPRSVSVGLERNPTYTPNGPGEYMFALKKWGKNIPDELSQFTSSKGQTGDLDATSVRNDREYLSRVGFGTPFQYLNVDLDTGSADVWVYSSETALDLSGNRPIWVIENSTSAKRIKGAVWSITYGDSSSAWGNVYTDHIDLGGIVVHDAVVESAMDVSPMLAAEPNLNGLFGLAYGLKSEVSPHQPTVLSTLLNQLDQQVFTADLKYHSSDGGYTFGYIDEGRHLDEIQYTPLIPDAKFWEFNFTGVHVGGQNVWYLAQWRAIADTGTTLILLSHDIAELYYSAIPSAKQDKELGGLWVFECNADTLPDFEIGLANGWVGTVPGRFMNYTTVGGNSTLCMGGLQEIEHDFGILGDIFLKAVYAVFDVAGGRIGFANKELAY